jgi:hypothetical protein
MDLLFGIGLGHGSSDHLLKIEKKGFFLEVNHERIGFSGCLAVG